MNFRLIIDTDHDEEVVARVHSPSSLTDHIEALVRAHTGTDRVRAWDEDGDIHLLEFTSIACITVLEGKTWAIDARGRHYRLRQRLYELEAQVPASFIRINKSSLANEAHLERFAATFSGAVDAVFKSGYREYVSRRCFANIKRRYEQ